MTWYQSFDGDALINLDRAEKITITVNGVQLAGVYATQAAARQAASRLCTAVDPTTITGV